MMAVEFDLDGQRFAALNGGPQFKFSEAISFQIHCDDQESRLFLGEAFRWRRGRTVRLAERQIRPLPAGRAQGPVRNADGPRPCEVAAGTKAFLQMKKFDIAALKRAYAGQN